MKTSQDPRHVRRQHIIQELFSTEFHLQRVSDDANEVLKHTKVIDAKIQKAAPDFPVDKINKVDLAILRLATYEILVEKKTPQNVVIDEAVELAKEFSNETSPAFVNGVLGKITTYAKST
ncbi:MAG TPA: transcription antitermination factor NusB [Candidatus Sulfotelmatobacter sp.]|jgi:N utilization substance protein B|nr:transcription antitermination factor NusB [Candidatus Sulfotelmatobacter sp.]